MLVEEEGSTYLDDNDGDSGEVWVLRPLRAAACTYRIAFAPRAGQKVLSLQRAIPRETDFKQSLCADIDGFSLHAAVRCAADDRQALEQLCRYITRPALANERVQTNAAGQVVLKLKTAWRDGTSHLMISPPELMQTFIERPDCGSQIRWFYGSSGSHAGIQARQCGDRIAQQCRRSWQVAWAFRVGWTSLRGGGLAAPGATASRRVCGIRTRIQRANCPELRLELPT